MANTEQQEIWKTHPDYPFIQASSLGRIRTVDRIVIRSDGREQFIKGRILKQQLYKCGYMYVQFSVNGKTVHLRVNRVVSICFIPNPDNLPEVNHKDNNRVNNVVSNLEWCTHEYNDAYREKYGTAINRPVIAINPETSDVFWFKSQREAARQLNVNQAHVTKVVKGKYNQTGGLWFTNADKNAVEKTRDKFGDKVAEKVEKLINGHRI